MSDRSSANEQCVGQKSDIRFKLESLLPIGVKVCISGSRADPQLFYAEELIITVPMVASRKAEFLQGRECARAALAQLGVQAMAITRGEGREPIWPRSFIGSIAHTGNSAIAIAAKVDDIVGVGVDIESAEPLGAELTELICHTSEGVFTDREKAKLLFSIKEAIYKCIYPELKRYVDFLEVAVCLDLDGVGFTARPTTGARDLSILKRLQGKYLVSGGTIFSVAWLIKAGSDSPYSSSE